MASESGDSAFHLVRLSTNVNTRLLLVLVALHHCEVYCCLGLFSAFEASICDLVQ